ncbi:MAG: hypothetical protein MJ189_03705 [Coriobacteriales bacterium]|nr:hypothetical protein [Coriobacteriales bacterium]
MNEEEMKKLADEELKNTTGGNHPIENYETEWIDCPYWDKAVDYAGRDTCKKCAHYTYDGWHTCKAW